MFYRIESIDSVDGAIKALKSLDDLSGIVSTFKCNVNSAGIMDEHAKTCFEALNYFIYLQKQRIKEMKLENQYEVNPF